MATKRQMLEDPNSCWNKADLDEEIFVLRAQDMCAPQHVRDWAEHAELRGCNPDKVAEARRVADRMEAWHNRHWPD